MSSTAVRRIFHPRARHLNPGEGTAMNNRWKIRARVLPAVVLLALIGSSAAHGTRDAASICKAKRATIGGALAMVFCGPAVANIQANGKTFQIKNGTCFTQLSLLSAQIGTIGGPRQGALQKLPLFYLLVSPKTPSKGAILYWIVDGKRYRADTGVRILIKGTKITFAGKLAHGAGFTGSGPFSGTLNCGTINH
jgi:hypothetical protein